MSSESILTFVALVLVLIGTLVVGVSVVYLFREMNYTPPKRKRRQTYIKP